MLYIKSHVESVIFSILVKQAKYFVTDLVTTEDTSHKTNISQNQQKIILTNKNTFFYLSFFLLPFFYLLYFMWFIKLRAWAGMQ